jgi:hypothetical protein
MAFSQQEQKYSATFFGQLDVIILFEQLGDQLFYFVLKIV